MGYPMILWLYSNIFHLKKNNLRLDRFQKDIENTYKFDTELPGEDSAVCSMQEMILQL